MKITLDIDEALIKRASKLTGIKKKTALVKRGRETLNLLFISRPAR
jgi:hypothetical protein